MINLKLAIERYSGHKKGELEFAYNSPKVQSAKQNPLNTGVLRGFLDKSLTMTYFHTGCSTIIGAESFHGPVRDGKGWYRLAIVIRHNLLIFCGHVDL